MPKIERKIGVEGAEATDCKVRAEGNKVDLKEENSEDVEEGEVPEDLTQMRAETKNKAKTENRAEEGEEDRAEIGVDSKDQASKEKGLMRINPSMQAFIFY